jgi:hypothetical protein
MRSAFAAESGARRFAGFFLPGSTRHVAGFVLIVAAYGGFLWVQGGAARAASFRPS